MTAKLLGNDLSAEQLINLQREMDVHWQILLDSEALALTDTRYLRVTQKMWWLGEDVVDLSTPETQNIEVTPQITRNNIFRNSDNFEVESLRYVSLQCILTVAVFWLPVAGVRYAVARGAPNIFRRAALVVLVEVKTETGISQGVPAEVFLRCS